jgi:hypothetical protein
MHRCSRIERVHLGILRQQIEVLVHLLAVADIGDEQRGFVCRGASVCQLDRVRRIFDGWSINGPLPSTADVHPLARISHYRVKFLRRLWQEGKRSSVSQCLALRPDH